MRWPTWIPVIHVPGGGVEPGHCVKCWQLSELALGGHGSTAALLKSCTLPLRTQQQLSTDYQFDAHGSWAALGAMYASHGSWEATLSLIHSIDLFLGHHDSAS